MIEVGDWFTYTGYKGETLGPFERLDPDMLGVKTDLASDNFVWHDNGEKLGWMSASECTKVTSAGGGCNLVHHNLGHLGHDLDFALWTVRQSTPVWLTVVGVPVHHEDIVVVNVDLGYARDDMMSWVEGDTVTISDTMQWHDDGVRLALVGWVPLHFISHPVHANLGVITFVRPEVLG